jgi:hypothetical protein
MISPVEGKCYHETSPDYFQFVPQGGHGFVPVGYGFRSVAYIVRAAAAANAAAGELDGKKALTERRKVIDRLDDEGIMATPKNSAFNELVMEAGRLSITNGGREVVIEYGAHPGVRFRREEEYEEAAKAAAKKKKK